jgi:hypothetical protein
MVSVGSGSALGLCACVCVGVVRAVLCDRCGGVNGARDCHAEQQP